MTDGPLSECATSPELPRSSSTTCWWMRRRTSCASPALDALAGPATGAAFRISQASFPAAWGRLMMASDMNCCAQAQHGRLRPAGRGQANPTSMIPSVAMLVSLMVNTTRYVGHQAGAEMEAASIVLADPAKRTSTWVDRMQPRRCRAHRRRRESAAPRLPPRAAAPDSNNLAGGVVGGADRRVPADTR
jgi:hypothetical protein